MLQSFVIFILLIYSLVIFLRKIIPRKVVATEGKAVLITGCDSGFGNRLAQRLNQIGFKVYATVLNSNSPGAQQLKQNAVFANKMIVLQMNVTNDSEVKGIYEKINEDLQSNDQILWALVNNAGVMTTGLLEWGTLDSYRKLFEVNVFGTVRTTRTFLPLLKNSKGRVINMNSFSGRFSFKRLGIYNMTKHSLIAFTDTLRAEMFEYGVKVLSIEPGFFKTHISSMQNFIEQLDDNWNQSTDQVKGFYGSNQGQKNYVLKIYDVFRPEDNIDIVVDDIIDAIINCRPKSIYSPMNFTFKIVSFIFKNCPVAFINWLIDTTERLL